MEYDEIAGFMRTYEQQYEHVAHHENWFVVRLDGRGFSSFTEKHFEKPFDERFHLLMMQTTQYLMEEFSAIYGYVASDEISLLFSPTWQMFDRRTVKTTTTLASSAGAIFTYNSQKIAHFDARLLSFESLDAVALYFDWRMADAERNALQTATYWTLRKRMGARQATKTMAGISVADKKKLVEAHGVNYTELPLWQKQGTHLVWQTYQKSGFNPIKQQEEIALRRRVMTHADFSSKEIYQEWLLRYCQEIQK